MKKGFILGIAIIFLIWFLGDTFAQTHSKQPLCDGLVLLHNYDIDATDSSGKSNDGTVVGATHNQTGGRFSGAYQFDGVNDYITIPDFSYGSLYSISFWFSAPPSNTNQMYTLSHDGYNYRNSFNSVIERANDRIGVCVRDTNDNSCVGRRLLDAGPVKGTGWHNAVVTVDSGLSSIYLDGSFVESVARGGDGFNPTTDFVLGGRSTDLDPDSFFNGTIDELAIWSRTLNLSEIDQIYNSGSPITCRVCTSGADTNLDNTVDMIECLDFVVAWELGIVSQIEVMNGISEWKKGC